MVKRSAPAAKRTDPFYLSPQWRRLRVLVLKRDKHKCSWCGRDVSGIGQARVDHVVPRRQRPDLALTASNCRALCVACDGKRHQEKGNPQLMHRGTDALGMPLDPAHHWYRR